MDDELLIEKIKKGNKAACEQLISKHTVSVYSYIQRMTGNKAETEDITQETFLRFWKNVDTFQTGKATISTWLHKVAHNICIDNFRKNRIISANIDILEGEKFEQDEVRKEQLQSKVRKVLTELPERQRSALILSHYQGFNNLQIAEILQTSIEAVESLLARARRHLRKRFSHQLKDLLEG